MTRRRDRDARGDRGQRIPRACVGLIRGWTPRSSCVEVCEMGVCVLFQVSVTCSPRNSPRWVNRARPFAHKSSSRLERTLSWHAWLRLSSHHCRNRSAHSEARVRDDAAHGAPRVPERRRRAGGAAAAPGVRVLAAGASRRASLAVDGAAAPRISSNRRLNETACHTTPFAWCTPFLKDF